MFTPSWWQSGAARRQQFAGRPWSAGFIAGTIRTSTEEIMGVARQLAAIFSIIATICGLAACGSDSTDVDDVKTIRASGVAFTFTLPSQPYGRIAGGTVTILEMPDQSTTTSADGAFAFEALPAGADATFIITAEGHPVGQTKTFTLPETDLEKVSFQIPGWTLYNALEGVVGVTTDPERCHLVSTITVVGKSVFDNGAHGVEGATVGASPKPDAEVGPVYFNSGVIPDAKRTHSSDDGGVLWGNVAPGEYTISASKDGVTFESIRMKCRAGVLVNASPPYGLQALAP